MEYNRILIIILWKLGILYLYFMYIFVIQLLAPYLHQSEIFLKIYKVAHHIFLQFIWKNMEVTSIRV